MEQLIQSIVQPEAAKQKMKWSERYSLNRDMGNVLNQDSFEQHVSERKSKPELKLDNGGVNPYYNPVNEVTYVGDGSQVGVNYSFTARNRSIGFASGSSQDSLEAACEESAW